MIIKVYGEQARSIQDGDIFTAEVHSVEGRAVVHLVKRPA